MQVEKERIIKMQMTGIKIMKTKKKLTFDELKAEIRERTKMFNPLDSAIEKSVTQLITREFLKQDESDELTY